MTAKKTRVVGGVTYEETPEKGLRRVVDEPAPAKKTAAKKAAKKTTKKTAAKKAAKKTTGTS